MVVSKGFAQLEEKARGVEWSTDLEDLLVAPSPLQDMCTRNIRRLLCRHIVFLLERVYQAPRVLVLRERRTCWTCCESVLV